MIKRLINIGTSGWFYDSWKGIYYPEKLQKDRWLDFYAAEFNTVEINSSFYRLPSESTVQKWIGRTGKDFLFSIKASRYITHIKRLKDCHEALKKFTSLFEGMGDRMGPILFQLPPRFKIDLKRMKEFIRCLPAEYEYVFEFRDESWFSDAVYGMLDECGCGIVISSSPGFPYHSIITGDICYIRMHGSGELYSSSYSENELSELAGFILENKKKKIKTYVYFNNDIKGFAIFNTRTLKRMLGENGTV